MAKNKDNPAPVTTNNTTATDDDFIEIKTQGYIYNADACKEMPLIGYLLNCRTMKPIARKDPNGQLLLVPCNTFVVHTTRPTKAKDREGNIVDVPAGEEVLIPATFILQQHLTALATHPDSVFEIKLQPDKKIKSGANNLWLYTLAAKKHGLAREGFGASAMLAPATQTPQLPQNIADTTDLEDATA